MLFLKFEGLSDWVAGLTLEERIAIADFSNEEMGEKGHSSNWLFDEWKSIEPFSKNKTLFKARLAELKINEAQFSKILKHEINLNLAAAPFWWAEKIENVYQENIQVEQIEQKKSSYPELNKLELLRFALPLIVDKIESLEKHFSRKLENTDIFNVNFTISAFLERLLTKISKIASRTLVLEMHCAKQQGLLKGKTPKQRYQDFINLLSDPQYSYQLLLEYPVLARKIVTVCQYWADSFLEFVEHLIADYPMLCETFSPKLGMFDGIGKESGDSHKQGKTVIVVNFSSGTKLVYKPRSISIEQHFQELLTWFNRKAEKLNFKILTVLDRKTHGWVEFITHKKCEDNYQLKNFYFQLGALKGLLYALKATDFHHENFIAHGEKIVAIDLETLFQAKVTGYLNSTDSFNVLDIGMLPTTLSEGEYADVSGMGANSSDTTSGDAWKNTQTDEMYLGKGDHSKENILSRPSIDSCPSKFILDINSGFSTVYQLIKGNKTAFLSRNSLLSNFVGDTIRLVFKNTQTYSDLLWESYHPSYLRCALQTNKLLDTLWGSVPQNYPTAKIIRHEVLDIFNHDIPYFEMTVDSLEVKSALGNTIDLKLNERSLDSVKKHISMFSDEQLTTQQWLISNSLKQKENAKQINEIVISNPFLTDKKTVDEFDYLSSAESLGDFLIKIAVQSDKYALWIGEHYQNESKLFTRLDASLYKGQLGIIWYLAYLAEVSKKDRYRKIAEKGIQHCLDNLLEDQFLKTSVGLFEGIGGFIYVISHLQELWPDKNFDNYIEKILASLPEKILQDEQLDVISGTAGCLLALQSLYQVTQKTDVLQLCKMCGDKLLKAMIKTPTGSAWKIASQTSPLAGLSHGSAGISLALIRLSKLLNDDTYFIGSRSAIAYENSLYSSEHNNWLDLRKRTDDKTENQVGWAWCNGAPGIAIERLESLKQNQSDCSSREQDDLALIVKSTLSSQWPSHYALCHGAFGNLDILSHIAMHTKDHGLVEKCRQGISQSIIQCSTPHGAFNDFFKNVPSLGLMVGTTGVGYALLRQISPEKIPNILSMEAPVKT